MSVSDATFHFFPLLPPEIQLQIWGNAVHHPRIVIVLERDDIAKIRRLCVNPIPPLLHACAMSRGVALGIYHKLPSSPYLPEKCLFVNPSCDALFIQGRKTPSQRGQLGWTLTESWFHAVRRLHWLCSRVDHIAIGLEGMAPAEWQQGRALLKMHMRPNVKRVTFVPRLGKLLPGQEAMFVLPKEIPVGMEGQGQFQERMREQCLEEIEKYGIESYGPTLAFQFQQERLHAWKIPEFDIMDVAGR